ncbi:hypothetical protein H0H81_000926 [Sphagnurus paluster]|uniref:Uncharacterized protein n=1 Tax=Sphagnurus paluster TaxID=117069 RepID=A0A9P7K6V0_9AGAR|nr:hypothetical protein H0H81_000926 [Sphagnurus paluster]
MDIQNGDTGAMDTTPIMQHPNDMPPNFIPTLLPNSLPASSVPPQLMPETSPVFQTIGDPSIILTTSMHAPMTEMVPSMTPMEVGSAPHIGPGPPGFLPDLAEPFIIPPPTSDNAMNLTDPHPLSASPPAQIPSPSIHGTASSYSVGVTSSLESALDQPGVVLRRSRANTSVSPLPVPPGYIAISPTAVGMPFLPPEVIIAKQAEVSPKAEAESVVAVENMLEECAFFSFVNYSRILNCN